MENRTLISSMSVGAFAQQNAAATTAATLIFAFFLVAVSTLRKPISRIPGPWYSRWTGLVLKYHWMRGTRSHYVHSLHNSYGRIVRLSPDEVSVCDIESVKTVYTVKENFIKPKWYLDFTAGVQNMFSTSNIDFHRKSRRMLAGAMAESSIHQLAPRVGGHADFTIQQMKAESETRKAVDVYKWWLFMTTDIIVEFTYGESFHMLQRGERNEYSYFLEHSGVFGIYRSMWPRISNLAVKILPLQSSKTMIKAVKTMIKAAQDGILIHQKLVEENGEDNVQKTFFTSLFKAQEDGAMIAPDMLVAEGQGFIIAGSDTTANTLTFLIWALCKHTDIKNALIAELQALPADYTDEDLRKMGLLNRIIKETLRLYSATPESLPRQVPVGGVDLCGFHLDAGTTVGAPPYSLHRDPAVFERPEEFDPSRWIAPSKNMTDSFMAFGRGSRVCIGQHLAQTELRMATARFFLTFPNARVSTREGMSDDDMVQTSYFIMSPKGHRCLIDVE
ncbi:hypothetical protein NLG97_g6126 [Lecanicillium saksenae]|uniref:Uncharacterized protein n=1 Tax=Lecanicillium saksenae TaxID=468837 RepID=A0ACC1QSD6_9HYPO|nr:hypothetical protein NLG97_g6126 [Lecanicillium saksenae]